MKTLPTLLLLLFLAGACTVEGEQSWDDAANDDDMSANDDDDDAPPPDDDDDDVWGPCPEICLDEGDSVDGPLCGYCGDLSDCGEESDLLMTAEFNLMGGGCCNGVGLLTPNVPPVLCATLLCDPNPSYAQLQASPTENGWELLWAIYDDPSDEGPAILRLGEAQRCGDRFWTQAIDLPLAGEVMGVEGIDLSLVNLSALVEYVPEEDRALARMVGFLDPAPLEELLGSPPCDLNPQNCNEEGLIPLESANVSGKFVFASLIIK